MVTRTVSIIVLALSLSLSGAFAQNPPSQSSTDMQNTMKTRYKRQRMDPMGSMDPAAIKEKVDQSMEILVEMGLMYKMIEPPQAVPVSDGIIVTFGNKVIKYDKDLNLLKEVELEINGEEVHELASKLAKQYSERIMKIVEGKPAVQRSPASAPTSQKTEEDIREEEIQKEIEGM